MLRYVFVLPLFLALCYWFDSFNELTDFIIPSLLIALTIFGSLKFTSLSKLQKLVALYISMWAINEISAYYFGLYYRNNSFPFHWYMPIQLLIYSLIYSKLFDLKNYTFYFWTAIVLLIVMFFMNSFYYGSLDKFPSINAILLCSIILPLSLFQFRKMLLFPVTKKLDQQPLFWFNLGTFIFFSFDFFFLSFLESTNGLPMWMYSVHWGVNLFLISTYFMAIFLDVNPKTNKL